MLRKACSTSATPLRNPKILHRVHRSQPLVAFLSQENLCYASPSFFFQIYFNIIFSSTYVNRVYFYLPHTRADCPPSHLNVITIIVCNANHEAPLLCSSLQSPLTSSLVDSYILPSTPLLNAGWSLYLRNRDVYRYKTTGKLYILYNQWDATYKMFFIVISAPHVSREFSAHHQELIKLCEPWVLSCFPALYRCPNPLTTAVDSRKAWQYPRLPIQFYKLLMMGGKTARNM
jgi:hypothetical protein